MAGGEILHYLTARKYAFMELMECIPAFMPNYGEELHNIFNHGVSASEFPFALTNRPVIVYGYDDLPYYYEFGILYNGDYLIGTITVDAIPKTDELIQYILPSINYHQINWGKKRYIGEYPNVYFGSNGGGPFVKLGGEDVVEATPVFSTVSDPIIAIEEYMDNIPEEDLMVMEYDLNEEANSLGHETDPESSPINPVEFPHWALSQIVEHFPYQDYYYEPYEEDEEFALSEEQLYIIQNNFHETQHQNTYMLPQYEDYRLRFTSWGGSCGPSAMSWLYRGYWDTYNGEYIHIHGDDVRGQFINYNYNNYDFSYYDYDTKLTIEETEPLSYESDNGLYHVWNKRVWRMNETNTALFHLGMSNGLKEATNDQYSVIFTTKPAKWIFEHNRPLLIMTGTHYLAGIGMGYTAKWGMYKNKYFFVHDNGNQISEHGYYPYWRKYNAWNLHYSWKKHY